MKVDIRFSGVGNVLIFLFHEKQLRVVRFEAAARVARATYLIYYKIICVSCQVITYRNEKNGPFPSGPVRIKCRYVSVAVLFIRFHARTQIIAVEFGRITGFFIQQTACDAFAVAGSQFIESKI